MTPRSRRTERPFTKMRKGVREACFRGEKSRV